MTWTALGFAFVLAAPGAAPGHQTSPPATPDAVAAMHASGEANTIDNGATTEPMRFLALVVQATGAPRYRAAFERGFDGRNRPTFPGRDSVVRYTFGEIELQRRNGNGYHGTWAASL